MKGAARRSPLNVVEFFSASTGILLRISARNLSYFHICGINRELAQNTSILMAELRGPLSLLSRVQQRSCSNSESSFLIDQ